MLFGIRMLRIGWRVQAKREASFPNEWAILRPSANGIIWKHLLEKKVRVGLRFGARLALPSPVDISLGACCQSCLVSFSEYCFASLIEIRPAHVRSFARQVTHQELCRPLDSNSGNRNKKRRDFKVLSSSALSKILAVGPFSPRCQNHNRSNYL